MGVTLRMLEEGAQSQTGALGLPSMVEDRWYLEKIILNLAMEL